MGERQSYNIRAQDDEYKESTWERRNKLMHAINTQLGDYFKRPGVKSAQVAAKILVLEAAKKLLEGKCSLDEFNNVKRNNKKYSKGFFPRASDLVDTVNELYTNDPEFFKKEIEYRKIEALKTEGEAESRETSSSWDASSAPRTSQGKPVFLK